MASELFTITGLIDHLFDWGFTPSRRENIGPPAGTKVRAKAAEGFQMYAALGRAGVGGARET